MQTPVLFHSLLPGSFYFARGMPTALSLLSRENCPACTKANEGASLCQQLCSLLQFPLMPSLAGRTPQIEFATKQEEEEVIFSDKGQTQGRWMHQEKMLEFKVVVAV